MTSSLEPGVDKRVLVVDVGGTNCRLALASGSREHPQIETLQRIATPRGDLLPSLRAYLAAQGLAQVSGVGVAAAGRVRHSPAGSAVTLTNAQLHIDTRSLATLGEARGFLVNDLAAVAAALPLLGAEDLRSLGPPCGASPGLRLVVGLGTGFGAAALTVDGALIETEAGHADLAVGSADEREWLDRLSSQGRVSVESVLSGPGLLRLHGAVAGAACANVPALLLRHGEREPAALKTMEVFSTLLGRTVGNLVLSLGAWGGAYLVGGVINGLGAALDQAAFRRGFEDKAPFAADLAAVSVAHILHPQPALLGMARVALAN